MPLIRAFGIKWTASTRRLATRRPFPRPNSGARDEVVNGRKGKLGTPGLAIRDKAGVGFRGNGVYSFPARVWGAFGSTRCSGDKGPRICVGIAAAPFLRALRLRRRCIVFASLLLPAL